MKNKFMTNSENDPTKGWVWDDENNVFMQPSIMFSDKWVPVKVPIFEADSPVYQYDPKRHKLYSDIVAQNDNIRTAKRHIPDLPKGVQNKNPTMYGEFDGNTFAITNKNENGIYRERYPAVSGQRERDGKFDYSPEKQRTRNEGPIPEGTYWINPQNIKYAPPKDSFSDMKNFIGKNPIIPYSIFPGGSIAWGRGKIEIRPKEVNINGVKRDNFTIHGGSTPGSRGCIDLTEYDKKLFDFLEKHRGDQDSIPIFVNYSKNKER